MSSHSHVGTPEWLTLDRDERVWVRARPSKNLLLLVVAVGTALFLALGVAGILFSIDVDIGRTVSLVVMVVLLVLTAGVFLLTRSREFAVTSHRICAAAGLGAKEVTTLETDAVTDVTLEQTGWQSLVKVGDLRFVDGDGETVRFTSIENPNWVHERVLEAVEADGDEQS